MGEGLAKRKGVVARRGLKEAWSKRMSCEATPCLMPRGAQQGRAGSSGEARIIGKHDPQPPTATGRRPSCPPYGAWEAAFLKSSWAARSRRG
jgi:hypothetical protein